MDFTPEGIKNTIFEIIQKGNNLEWVRDNIYVDSKQNNYHLDHLGFHSVNVFGTHEINRQKRVLEKAVKQYAYLINKETDLSVGGIKKLKKYMNKSGGDPKTFYVMVENYIKSQKNGK